MWRSTGDIVDSWASIRDITRHQLSIWDYNGQGCFNDMDMLVVGMNGKGNVGVTGCTYEEYKSHFSIWAFLNSPLMIGCDIRNMSDETKSILTNRDIIAINQDPAARQPYVIEQDAWNSDTVLVLAKPLEGGDMAIGFFNLSDNDSGPWFALDSIGLGSATGKALEATELWTGEKVIKKDVFHIPRMAPHTCLVYRAKTIDA